MKPAALTLALLASAIPSVARAADLPCGPAEKGTVELDGLTDDWKDVDGIDAGGRDANASFTVKCNIDPGALYLLVDVRDDYFVRTPKARPGEDHLALTIAGKRAVLYPGNSGDIPLKQVPPWKGMKAVSALQEHGWAVEIGIPLDKLPGYKPGTPSLSYSLAFADSDSKASLKTERTVGTSGRIAFAEGESVIEAFLKDRGLKRSDVWWEKPISLGRKSGGRAFFAGKYLAVISDGYVFIELPFRERKDLKDARVLDLAGDGRGAVVMRYLEKGTNGAPTKAGGGGGPVSGQREVIAAFRATDDRVSRVFAAEVGKQQGPSRIEDKVSFIKRGRATDILIEAGAASGWTAASYQESPAEDMVPVMLPWSDDRKARYQFEGDEYRRQ